MPITVEIEGKGTAEFPDGTDPSVIEQTVRQQTARQKPAPYDPNGIEGGVPKWGRDNPNMYAGVETALDMAPALAAFAGPALGVPLAGGINAGAKAIQRNIAGEDQSGMASLGDFAKGAAAEGGGRVIGAGIQGAANIPAVKRVTGKIADKLTDMTLKQPTTLRPSVRSGNVDVLHEGGFLPNPKGVDKINSAIDGLENKISTGIAAGKNADVRGSFDKAILNLEDMRGEANYSSDPVRNNQLIDDEIERIRNHPLADDKGTVGIADLQKMKVAQGREIAKSYGEQKPQFAIAVDKARVRGLKEELEDKLGTHFPELKETNKQLGRHYAARDVLERATNRIQNNQGIGIGLPIKSGGGAAIGGAIGGVPGAAIGGGIGTAAGILEHPAVAPRVGQALYNFKEHLPSATPKLEQFVKGAMKGARGAFDAAILKNDPLEIR